MRLKEGEKEKSANVFIYQVLIESSDVCAIRFLLVGIHNDHMVALLTCTRILQYCILSVYIPVEYTDGFLYYSLLEHLWLPSHSHVKSCEGNFG